MWIIFTTNNIIHSNPAYPWHSTNLLINGGGLCFWSLTLNAYQRSLDSLYASHCNEDTHRLNISFLESADLMKEQNDRATDISEKMNRYTFLMLIFTAVNVGVAVWQLFFN